MKESNQKRYSLTIEQNRFHKYHWDNLASMGDSDRYSRNVLTDSERYSINFFLNSKKIEDKSKII
jgi:hypothetical protein